MPSKCLFTESELAFAETVEHAPPRSLGGRFKAVRSVSAQFNNRCGSTIDKALIDSYAPVVLALTALMSSDHRSTFEVQIEHDGRLVSYGPGETFTDKRTIIRRDENQVVDWVSCNNPATLRKIADRSPNLRDKKIRLHVPIDPFNGPTATWSALSVATEAACLKALLVIFDHCNDYSEDSWVRGCSTSLARKFVVDAVANSSVIMSYAARVVMGIDYAQRERILEIARRYRKNLGEYEHIFVVCGNSGTRTLDAVFLAFGWDPHTFRLSGSCVGLDFCQVAGCDPLRGGQPWFEPESSQSWRVSRRGGCPFSCEDFPETELLRNMFAEERDMLCRRARQTGVLSEPSDSARKCRNFYVAVRHWHGLAYLTTESLVAAMLLNMWPSAPVEELVAGFCERNRSLHQAIKDTVRPLLDEIPPWAVEAAELYNLAFKELCARVGPPLFAVSSKARILQA